MKLKTGLYLLIFSLLLVWGAVVSYPDEKLHLIFCDVGQGDASLISLGETQILIDGGPSEKVLGCLSSNLPFWDRTIEVVVLTHPESDHLTGLISVVERYTVKQFVANSLVNDSDLFWELRERVAQGQIPVHSPQTGDKIKIGEIVLEVEYPEEKLGSEIVWKELDADTRVLGTQAYTGSFNNTAIVLRLTYGEFDALLTGDVGFDQEERIKTGEVEVLKVGHHGSKYSTGEEFLKMLKPSLAVISVGRNSYGHPTGETLERLREAGVKILQTNLEGDIEIVTDGKNWYTQN